MKLLDNNYSIIIDHADELFWNNIIKDFNDASIYQTWSYNSIRFGTKNVSSLILKEDKNVVGAAQVRIIKVPFIPTGVAYVRFGPMAKSVCSNDHPTVFRQAIKALRNEYVCKRNLFLLIFPMIFKNDNDNYLSILKEEGFKYYPRQRIERTILIDLNCSIEQLRKNLKSKWRYHLNRAEKNELKIIEGYDDHLFDRFNRIYQEMIDRKNFNPSINIDEYRLMQNHLPEEHKLKLIICISDNKVCAGVICSAIGNTGIFVFGATSNIGLKSRGSYLLHWKVIEWLKDENFDFYDLNGISPKENPGTYQFKSGMAGKNGCEEEFLGKFYACNSKFNIFMVLAANTLKSRYGKLNHYFKNFMHL